MSNLSNATTIAMEEQSKFQALKVKLSKLNQEYDKLKDSPDIDKGIELLNRITELEHKINSQDNQLSGEWNSSKQKAKTYGIRKPNIKPRMEQ